MIFRYVFSNISLVDILDQVIPKLVIAFGWHTSHCICREAKKDQVGRQAYRLLTSIHESFEQVSEKILATDRVRREIAEYEKKLAAVASRSLNVDKLQADVDVIMKENEFLEQQFHRDG